MRFKFIEEHQSTFSIGRMCHVMDVSPRGLRAFRSRPASRRQRSDLVTLAHIKDPLHGGEGLTFASGEAVDTAKALGEHARAYAWKICCAEEVITGFSEWVVAGGSALVSRGDGLDLVPVIELHALEQE